MKQVVKSTSKGIEMNAVLAEIARLRAENEELARKAANKAPSLGIKLSQKGAVSVYGLGRFPVTLYGSQWERLIALVPDIEKFLKANSASLAHKS